MSETQDAHAEASARPPLDHRLRRMVGRDPNEPHRTATPLELLFDLTFVVAFSQAGAQTAHLLELGHWAPAIIGFLFAVFAIWWAWINYSWLASAYDNDDIFFRVATMVRDARRAHPGTRPARAVPLARRGRARRQRRGRRRLRRHARRHDRALAARREARHRSPPHRADVRRLRLGHPARLDRAHLRQPAARADARVHGRARSSLELVGPYVAEHGREGGTPWHAHHIAERYGLLVIITLGEIILGTILAISAVVDEQDWSVETVAVAFGGTALAFGLWWVYFTMPSGKVLQRFRERGFVWGYLHYFIFVALAGAGAGLHVAAYEIEGVAHIGIVQALLTVVVPVGIFMVALFTIYSLLLRQFDPFHIWLFIGSMLVLVLAVVAVAAGATFGVGILITAASPFVVVVGYETVGHRHQAAALQRALGD